MRKSASTNSMNEKKMATGCPITTTMLMIGGRWKVIILWNLKNGALRYSELKKAMPSITEKMLTQQLKGLIEQGWVSKTDFKEIPPRTQYSLTKLGRSFMPVLQQVYDWGIKRLPLS